MGAGKPRGYLCLDLAFGDDDALLLPLSAEPLEVGPPPFLLESDALVPDSDALLLESLPEPPELGEALESPVLD